MGSPNVLMAPKIPVVEPLRWLEILDVLRHSMSAEGYIPEMKNNSKEESVNNDIYFSV